MLLTKYNLQELVSLDVELPQIESFDLPEKVIQFGTGMLLRGLPDFFIDKANKKNMFNGRVLVVKSTEGTGLDQFEQQDDLYTVCTKGIEHGVIVEKYTINNCISRVLSAKGAWEKVLEAAHQPELQIVVSNTTEAGIVPDYCDVSAMPPSTFPGKLLALLYRRYTIFQGDGRYGMVILPTELITDNGDKLKQIILDLAEENGLDAAFKNWLENANYFCNTLVDRIVVGMSPATASNNLGSALPYEDKLMIMTEPFRLWAIETDSERVKDILSFAPADHGVILAPSIEKFKQLKLRILNGSHTLSCALALLNGFQTVGEAMENEGFSSYVSGLMREIGAAILDNEISEDDVSSFSSHVLERFKNPFLKHQWSSIALNYTAKIKMRAVGLLSAWYEKNQGAPVYLALGIAVYLKLMQTERCNNSYFTTLGETSFELKDTYAPVLYEYWEDPEVIVQRALQDASLWGEDLTQYPGFHDCVERFLEIVDKQGALVTNFKEYGI